MAMAFSSGIGYGGTQEADSKQLREGRKTAAKRQAQSDKETIEYLKKYHIASNLHSLVNLDANHVGNGTSEDVSGCNEAPFHRPGAGRKRLRLVKMLQTVFRDQIPSDWGPRRCLYETALDVCHTVANSADMNIGEVLLDHDADNKIEIEESQDETVFSALEQFAEIAECVIAQPDTASVDAKFAARVIEIRNAARLMVQRVRDQKRKGKNASIISVMTQQDIYKKELGPLRFDVCPNLNEHYFSKPRNYESAKTNSSNGNGARSLFKELSTYKTALPVEYGSSIFVRAVEHNLHQLRVLILGPDETPYANGCFIFDVLLPSNYPHVNPNVHFVNNDSQRFNPNLYQCGKVCLSLLGTWNGPGWISGESTLLQVLISIQSLILVPDPYFNEPGYESVMGTILGKQASNSYNANIRSYTLKTSIYKILHCIAEEKPSPYPEFDDIFRKHYLNKRHVLEKQLALWAKNNSSLRRICDQIHNDLTKLATSAGQAITVTKKRPPRSAINYKVDPKGVIELLVEDDDNKQEAVSSKRRRRRQETSSSAMSTQSDLVVDLVDDDQSDCKMPAIVQIGTDTSSSSGTGETATDAVDLT